MRVMKLSKRTASLWGKTTGGLGWLHVRGSLVLCVVAMAFVCCSAQSGQNADKAPQSAETTGQLKAGQLAADHAPKARDQNARAAPNSQRLD